MIVYPPECSPVASIVHPSEYSDNEKVLALGPPNAAVALLNLVLSKGLAPVPIVH